MRRTAALLFLVVPAVPAVAQTHFTFDLDPVQSGFQWSATTNQGSIIPNPTSLFDLAGTLELELSFGPQGVTGGRFVGGDAATTVDLLGEFTSSMNEIFEITGARLAFDSDTFVVGAGGTFSATVTGRFTAGELKIAPPLGPGSLQPLAGKTLAPALFVGRIVVLGNVVAFDVPAVSLDFPVAAPAVSGNVLMDGALSADAACPGPQNYCVTSTNSVGPGALIQASGSTSVAVNNLTLSVNGLPPNQFGLFFFGPNQLSAPFGDGVRCVDTPFFRYPPQAIPPAGIVGLAVDVTAAPTPSGTIDAGSTLDFQFWYRDPAAQGAGFNTSDAVEIFFCP